MEVTDIIIPIKSANSMFRFYWSFSSDYLEETYSVWRDYYYDTDTFKIIDKPIHRDAIAWIKIKLNYTFKIIEVEFLCGPEIKTATESPKELTNSIKKEFINELKQHKIYLYSKDVLETNITLYPKAKEYLERVLVEKYGETSGVDENLSVLSIPEPLWATYGLVNAYSYYSPSKLHMVFPARENYETPWSNCIAVHEYFHHFQHQKKILLTPDETGMTKEDFSELAAIIEGYEKYDGLDGIAKALGLPTSLLKRIQIVTNKLDEYSKEYYNILTERHSHAEQFNFLKSQGIATENIIKTMGKKSKGNPNWPKVKELIEKSEEISVDSYEKMLKMVEEDS